MSKNYFTIIFIVITLVLLSLLSIAEFYAVYNTAPPIMLSLSSDGNYAVTSHDNGDIFLWDIARHKQQLIARHSNIYSAYFIKHSQNFMWQDKVDNQVHIQNVTGQKILNFTLSYPVYGHVMTTDLQHYIASDIEWNLYAGYGKNQHLFKIGYRGFDSVGKLLNLSLSKDDNYLLTAGAGSGWDKYPIITGENSIKRNLATNSKISLLEGIVLWSVKTLEPLQKFPKTLDKVFASLSLDNRYVVAGDAASLIYIWDRNTKTQSSLDDLTAGHFMGYDKISNEAVWDNTGLIDLPEIFKYQNGIPIFAVKFIDAEGNYLRFTKSVRYAISYNVSDLKPKKYIYLGEKPWLSIHNYEYDQSLDTAPEARILAISQLASCGIVVYRFDAKMQTLTKIWES
ncbi:hypothetical protein BH10PSE19_BH10PSE19_11270 [soil metagenome]